MWGCLRIAMFRLGRLNILCFLHKFPVRPEPTVGLPYGQNRWWPPLDRSHSRHYSAEPALLNNKPISTRAKVVGVKELLEALEKQYEKNSMNAEQLTKLVQTLETQSTGDATQQLSSEQTLFLLGGCGTHMPALRVEQRIQLFDRFWQYLQRNKKLTAAHYYIRLQVLQHNRAPLVDVSAFIRELSAADTTNPVVSPNLYAAVLAVVCATGNMPQATKVLAEMRAHNFALTERNFIALITGHARNGELQGCRQVLDSMVAAGVPISSATQTAMVCAYLENGEPMKATEVLAQFHRQFEVTQVLEMLRSAMYVHVDAQIVVQLVCELPADYTNATEVPLELRNICIELLHNGKYTTVRTVMETLPTPHFNENQNIDSFGAFLLHELFRAQVEAARIVELAALLVSSGKNTRALHIVSEIALRRNPLSALVFFDELAKQEALRPHYFWPLLMNSFRRDGESGILHVLRLMADYKVTFDADTLQQYVLPRLAISLESPEQAVKKLNTAGVKPSQMLTPVIAHLLTAKKLHEALHLAPLYPVKLQMGELFEPLSSMLIHVRATKRYHQFAKLLHILAGKSESPKEDFAGQLLSDAVASQPRLRTDGQALQRLFGELEKIGLTISSAAVDSIQIALKAEPTLDNECLAQTLQSLHNMTNRELVLANQGRSASMAGSTTGERGGVESSFIKHPRDMSLDELECHLVELEAKKLNARGVLRRLLQLCVRDGRLERAVELKAKCDALKVQVSPGMLASVLDMYIKLKDLPHAQQTLQRLQRDFPGFQVDEHKLIDYAALLVQMGQLEAAQQLLQHRSGTQRIQGGDYVLKNVWNYLNQVAQHAAQLAADKLPKERNITRETFEALQRLGYCRSHNTVLGPIVREYLLRGDIESAVGEFCRLAERHKHTPLQYELLALLVRLSNGNAADVAHYGSAASGAATQRLLAVVSESVTKVHGGINLNSALLLAFAESGTDNQLRRLLIDPEFRINQELLLKNCEHLGEAGAVSTLLRLARGSRGLGHLVNEQRIYDMLLQHCVKGNNTDAALDLFERLEADDELKISQDFLRQLVTLLRVNNMEVPNSVALRAQMK